ncbi:MAG: thiol protease/hemagglutinin PrtT [Porphyromonadaceae bacterium]|nr:thiol protease/hemagglutinin PrtT [Porphyromonadaceae bacterium]
MKPRSILSYLVFGLYLLLTWSSWAGPIGREQAMRLAERYVQVDRVGELRLAQSEKLSGVEPAYYIFNDTDRSGFVIISGDDATTSILGYSSEGQILLNSLPLQLSSLLRLHQEQVKELRSNAITPGLPSPSPKPNPKVIRGPLTKSLWNQDEPFNDQAPKIGQERTVTGCVATAIAQVMYYHKWPTQGKGEYKYKPRSGSIAELSADFSKSTYDWTKMTDVYAFDWEWNGYRYNKKGRWTQEQGEAVARLMSDIGIAVKMNYNLPRYGGSGAYMNDAARALKEYFSYHVRHLSRNDVPNALFLSSIQQELDLENPIIMSGAQDGAGHAWVIDGYDENGYLHANWGWGGLSNGYFALSFMSPMSLGIGGGRGGFNQYQDVILVRPDKTGHEPFPAQERGYAFESSGGLSINSTTTDLSQNKIGLTVTKLGTKVSDTYRGELAFSLRSASGHEVMLEQSNLYLVQISKGTYFPSLDASITLQPLPADGVYTLRAVCREVIATGGTSGDTNFGPWIEVEYGEPLSLEINQGQIILPTMPTEIELSLTKAPKQTALLWRGHEGGLQLSVSNPTRLSTDFGYIVMELSQNGAVVRKIQTAGYQFFGYSAFDGIVSCSADESAKLSAGLYDVTFFFLIPSKTVHYIDGTSETLPEKSYPIRNPFGAYRLEVLESSGLPVLVYKHNPQSHLDKPNDNTKNLEIRVGEDVWTEEELDVERLDDLDLSIGCEVKNDGKAVFKGMLRYDLVDPESGQRYPLATTKELTIDANKSLGIVDTKTKVPMTAFESIPSGHTYELHIMANISGTDRDVWAPGVYRRILEVRKADTPTPPKPHYKVTLTSSEGGSISIPDVDLSAVEAKKQLKVLVEPEIGYELVSLMAGGKDIKATMTFVVESDMEVVARFAKKSYRVSQKIEGEGVITIKGARLDAVPHGAKLSVEALPVEGYELASLMAGGKDIKATMTFVVESDMEVVARFVKKSYRVELPTELEHATLHVEGAQDLSAVEYGTEITLVVKPEAGYLVEAVKINGRMLEAPYRFTVVEQCKVEVNLKQDTDIEDIVEPSVLIYPNPASDFVIIKNVRSGTEILLLSLDGQVLRRASIPRDDEFRWSLDDLESGVYIVRIGAYTYKLGIR